MRPVRPCVVQEEVMGVRLLVTDPLHPAVPGTIDGVQAAAAAAGGPPWTVLGLLSDPIHVPGLALPLGVDEVVMVPGAEAPDWAARVVTAAVELRIDAVLPWTVEHARLLAATGTELAELGVALVCPPAAHVWLTCDRWEMASCLSELGIPTPETMLVDQASDLGTAAQELGYPGRRLLVRPRRPGGSWGSWSVRDDAGLGVPGPLPALPLYPLMAAAATCTGPLDLLVQRQEPGLELEVDVLALDGKVLAAVERSATRTVAGLCVEGTVGPPRLPVSELVEQVVAALGWSQLLTVGLIWNPMTGRTVVSEVTAGASRCIGASTPVGVSLLAAAVELAVTGRAPSLPAAEGAPAGIRRYFAEQVWPV